MAHTTIPSGRTRTADDQRQLSLALDGKRETALTLSVVIPVHNGGEKFRQCLASLAAASPAPTEIIVVADGDSDGSWRVAEEFGARVVRLPEAGGPGRARNAGGREARGDVIVFFDADVTIPPDALARIAEPFRTEPRLAAVFGSYDDAPVEKNFLSQYKNLFHHYVHQTGRMEASTFWAGCGAVRREVFLALGGFDEAYRRPSIEDIEFGYRLRRAGHPVRLEKNLQVKHLKRWDTGSLLRTEVWQRAVPWTELILRDGRFIADLNVAPAGRLSVALAYLAMAEIIGACWWPPLLAVALASLGAMLALNAGLLRFFHEKRGLTFALSAVPWLWLYHLYCGFGFAVGLVRHWTRHGQRETREH